MQEGINEYLKKYEKPLYGRSCTNSTKFGSHMMELSGPPEEERQTTYHIPKDNILFIEITEFGK